MSAMHLNRLRNLKSSLIAVALGTCMCGLPSFALAANDPLTDEQVVSAMKKGVDYLLKSRKADNWESGTHKTGPQQMLGGETSLALYALLHTGHSLQDEPEYQAKLHWRSQEIAPVITWLAKIDTTETYAAGLQASALTLVPKRPETAEALERNKWYTLCAMGAQGGYSYYQPGHHSMSQPTFLQAWANYYKSHDAASKQAFDARINAARDCFGGVELAFSRLLLDLKDRRKTAKGQEAVRIDREIKEAGEYFAKNLPKDTYDAKASLKDSKDHLAKLLNAEKTGNMTGINKWDGALNKSVPAAKADLPDLIKAAKATIENQESLMKANFFPLGDLSNGQYGTLGAWALADFGIELPDKYWEVQDKFWRTLQRPDGGWVYGVSIQERQGGKSSGTMTVAGIASLFVAQEFVDNQLRLVPKPDKNIDAGLEWLNKNFSPDAYNLYYAYGVERVGLASGLKFFGTVDWYKAISANIIKQQAADGSMGQTYGPVVSTSYALLFLARGRNPICFNKLQYNGPWNARPRDDAYITHWLSKRFEKPINWQVVNLQVKPEEWLDAPVLLITGSQDPKFTPEDLAKLRTFINSGGMIFSTADGATAAFTNAMKKYAADLVDKKYEMRMLPKDHHLFSKEMGIDMPQPPQLWGMSNGVREIWIHSPQDVGADWQQRKYASKTSFELGAALYFYASGMASLRSKLQPLIPEDKGGEAARTVNVARVDYAGNSDPEPGAWARLAKLSKTGFKTSLKLDTVKFADLDPKKNPLAHLTGTTKVTFTDEEAQALKKYLDGGGLLFVDAAGGNADFVASAQELIKKVYPGEELQAVPPDHSIYTGTMADGIKIEGVDFRKYGMLKLQRRIAAPALQQIAVNGKTRVVFSAYDVCSGFLGTSTWGILGYGPKTSEALARNIILHAVGSAP